MQVLLNLSWGVREKQPELRKIEGPRRVNIFEVAIFLLNVSGFADHEKVFEVFRLGFWVGF